MNDLEVARLAGRKTGARNRNSRRRIALATPREVGRADIAIRVGGSSSVATRVRDSAPQSIELR